MYTDKGIVHNVALSQLLTAVKLVYVMAVKMMFTSRNFITAILCAIQKAQIIFERQRRHERRYRERAREIRTKLVECRQSKRIDPPNE